MFDDAVAADQRALKLHAVHLEAHSAIGELNVFGANISGRMNSERDGAAAMHFRETC